MIAALLLTTVLLAACGGPPPATAWSGLISDGRTAYLTATDRIYAVDTDPFTNNLQRQVWAYPPPNQGAAVTFHGPPVLSEDGVLYAGSDSPTGHAALFALDTTQPIDAGDASNPVKTVAARWSYPTGEAPPLGSVFGGVASDGQLIYVGTNDGYVKAFNAGSGQVVWQYPAVGQTPIGRVWSTPVVSGAVVYAASQDHHLYALDAETGQPVWPRFKADAMLAGSPTVYGDRVYVGSFDQKLYAISAGSGEKQWEFLAQGWLWDGPVVFDDTLYFGDLSGNLYALGLDGSEVWRLTGVFEGMLRAQPLVTQDRIYVATSARKLYAINRETRAIAWTFTALQDGEQLLTPPVLTGDGNTLLVAPLPAGPTPVRLYAIDTRSGNLAWQFPVSNQ
jgi:outer membrane protein assembly factor BamB